MAAAATPPRYATPTAEHILQIAEQQGANGINYRLFFYEQDPESFAALKPVVDEYAARGVQATADFRTVPANG